MKLHIANGHIVTGSAVLDAATIEIHDGSITRIDAGRHALPDIDLNGGWFLPGFIDVQVNGGGGVLFNDDISVDGIAAIGAAHSRFGTTGFLPTLISDTADRIHTALSATDDAIAAGIPGVLGVHIEGPFINEQKRGIHEAEKISQLGDAMIDLLTAPRKGRVVLTIAPECVTTEQIHRLIEGNVILCAGHTNASYEQTRNAIDAGMTGFTHLFNAMSPLTHRAPGAVGAALDTPRVWCGLIVDNAHLHPATVRIAIRNKGRDKIMLVTDAMPSIGTDLSAFTLQGKRIEVHDGICAYEDGTLAGSDLDMAAAFRNTAAITGLAPDQVAEMSSRSAATFLGLNDRYGSIAVGNQADFVWLDADLQPQATWIAGAIQGHGQQDIATAAG